MRRFLISTLPALPLLAACYTYAPLQYSSVREGEGVRLRVTAAFSEKLEPLLGSTDARVISGILVRALPDTLIVEVPTAVRADIGTGSQMLRQRVSIPKTELVDLEMRRLDSGRTGTIVAVASVGIVVLIVKSLQRDPGHENPPTGGGPELRRP